MSSWPAPASYTKKIPRDGEAGSFRERRDERIHCGIDIYAPAGSEVWAIEDGVVIDVGIQTTPSKVPYWNITHYVLVQIASGVIFRYAELGDILVKKGETVTEEQCIGHISQVIDVANVNDLAPGYIQQLKRQGNTSMLHLEAYASPPKASRLYLGGNWFSDEFPEYILDPTPFLKLAGGR